MGKKYQSCSDCIYASYVMCSLGYELCRASEKDEDEDEDEEVDEDE